MCPDGTSGHRQMPLSHLSWARPGPKFALVVVSLQPRACYGLRPALSWFALAHGLAWASCGRGLPFPQRLPDGHHPVRGSRQNQKIPRCFTAKLSGLQRRHPLTTFTSPAEGVQPCRLRENWQSASIEAPICWPETSVAPSMKGGIPAT